jgi:hypothetical protein
MTMKRRAVILVVLLAAAVAVVVVIVFASRHPSTDGIDVTVVNRGPGSITDVEIQGVHHGYPLGKLAPSGSGSGRITTGSQSDIAVEFRDAEGKWHRVESGVTFKRDDRGKVTIEIERDALAKVENQIERGKQ